MNDAPKPIIPDNRKKPIKVTELLLRDAHQSLLATRMRLDDMLPVCEALDNIGYYSLEVWGGATFDACLRFLDEDPWERLRQLKKALPKTPLQMLLRGQNLVGYRHYADDVVDRFVDKAIEYGMDIFRIFDALNDPRNLERAIKRTIEGGAHAQGTICYTVSPVHTLDMFVRTAKRLEDLGCHSIVIKDMAALLTPQPAYEIVRAFKEELSVPIHVHTHFTTGVAPMVLMRAVDAGADGVDTAISALSGGPGHVATEAFVESMRGTPHDTELDLKAFEPIAAHVREIRKNYQEFESSFRGAEPRIFLSQIPGGMLSNLESQLRQQNCSDKMDAVLEEVPKVRKDMGYIPLVTPTSQIVGTQAVFNVLLGERYKNTSQQSKDIFAGKYGETPVPVDPEIQKKVLGGEEPITCRPADLIDNEFDKLKSEIADMSTNDDDVLSYALFPQVWKEFWKKRHDPQPEPEAVREESAAPEAAAAAAPAPAPRVSGAIPAAGSLRAGQRFDLALTVQGKRYLSTVEVVEG